MFSLTKFVKICYNTYRKCGRPLPGSRRPGPPVGGRPLPAHLPRSRAFQARASWKLEAGTLWRAGSWRLNEGAAGSWELRRRSWKFSRAASWENEGAAGSSKLGGWREGAAGATGENGACAVLQIRQLEAARGELAQASWTEGAAERP